MNMFDREIFFDHVRQAPFGGSLSQRQVDGMNGVLTVWERFLPAGDLRWLSNMLAQEFWETAQEMWPISEYGKGEGYSYGVPDPETGETYYGRGLIMVTWRQNYERTDQELGLTGDHSTVWHADNMLNLLTSAGAMFWGMHDGWFRADEDGPQTLERYFNATTDDPFNAREIINGDKTYIPDWTDGRSIGELIAGYHMDFLMALQAAAKRTPPLAG